jgi:hypothetical protein
MRRGHARRVAPVPVSLGILASSVLDLCRGPIGQGRIGKEVHLMEDDRLMDSTDETGGTVEKPAGTRGSARGSAKKGAAVKGPAGKAGARGPGKKKAARKPATNRTTKGAVKAGATRKPMKPVALKGKGKKAARRR